VYVATNYTLYDISLVPGASNGCSFEHDYAKTMPKLIVFLVIRLALFSNQGQKNDLG